MAIGVTGSPRWGLRSRFPFWSREPNLVSTLRSKRKLLEVRFKGKEGWREHLVARIPDPSFSNVEFTPARDASIVSG